MMKSLPCLPIQTKRQYSQITSDVSDTPDAPHQNNLSLTLLKLEHLYSTAISSHTSVPAVSRHCLSQLISTAILQDVTIPQEYLKKFCPQCFTFYIPGVNMLAQSSRKQSLKSFPKPRKQHGTLPTQTTNSIASNPPQPTPQATPAPAFANPFSNPFASASNSNNSLLSINRNKKQKTQQPTTSLLGSLPVSMLPRVSPATPSLQQGMTVTTNQPPIPTTTDNSKEKKDHESLTKQERLNEVHYKCLCCGFLQKIIQGISVFDMRNNNEAWASQLSNRVENLSDEKAKAIAERNLAKKKPFTKKQSDQPVEKLKSSSAQGKIPKISLRRLRRGGSRTIISPKVPIPPTQSIVAKPMTLECLPLSSVVPDTVSQASHKKPIIDEANNSANRNINVENLQRSGISLPTSKPAPRFQPQTQDKPKQAKFMTNEERQKQKDREKKLAMLQKAKQNSGIRHLASPCKNTEYKTGT